MIEHELTGLHGENPLGLFAALGLLRVLDDEARERGVAAPTLAYPERGEPFPHLRSDRTLEQIAELVISDAQRQKDNVALQLAYSSTGGVRIPSDPDATRDLKPPLDVARGLLKQSVPAGHRASGLAAGWFSELVADLSGKTKPTAFHFTAGQQTFLSMVEELRRSITADDVTEALRGPWTNASTLPSLSWDSSVARYYALRASNPSTEKRGSVPAANWLAVIAMEFFPVVEQHGRLVTAGVEGGWKSSTFCWPLWNRFATCATLSSLLRLDCREWDTAERAALGIREVYRADILRSDQGGYGSFTPAAVVTGT